MVRLFVHIYIHSCSGLEQLKFLYNYHNNRFFHAFWQQLSWIFSFAISLTCSLHLEYANCCWRIILKPFKVFRFRQGIQVDDETHWAGFTHHNLTIPLHKRVPQVDVFPADHWLQPIVLLIGNKWRNKLLLSSAHPIFAPLNSLAIFTGFSRALTQHFTTLKRPPGLVSILWSWENFPRPYV